ncbi:MAG: polyprenyl synthetase family protein [Saprospiraceae bacterium]|nr:polyprenyl synthetase family protein [Saprospiraceae bacterium]
MAGVFIFATQIQLLQALSTHIDSFKRYLEDQQFSRAPQTLYAPVDYILSLGGKRVRPALVLLGAEIFGGPMQLALPAAFAIELFHNFTLIHDDIMDEADIRRGQPTVHKKYNSNTAILSGDVMMVYAYEYLSKSPKVPETMKVFNTTAIEVCEGQQYDMDFENRNEVSIEEYLEMISLKTAVLLGAALEIGAITAGASDTDRKQIYAFGKNLGIAFQLKDDILDTFAENAAFGKKIGGDIIQNKKTFLLITALNEANTEQRNALDKWLANSSDDAAKVAGVKAIYNELGIQAKSEAAAEEYYQKALLDVDALSIASDQKQKLKAFAEQLLKRTK